MSEIEINLVYGLPVILVLYWLTSRKVLLNNLVLLVGGYLLYSWGHLYWGLLLFVLSLLDYYLVKKWIAGSKHRRVALFLGLFVNLAAWLVCKYSSSLGELTGLALGFPLGISFYMLRKISYLVDSYRGKFNMPHSFMDYALYVSFYPQIFSGPIERPDDFIAQIRKARNLNWSSLGRAFPLILMGLFKKIVIADNLSMIVDRVFRLDCPSRLMLAAGSLGYTFEIYADFSGYTDLSRGFSFLLGFETSRNFNKPYIALTPQDFWNRWHITLSNWLRDYIFFPLRRWLLRLTGSRGRWLADWITPVVTMLISGLWHGTGWTYLLWGFYYGVLLAVCQTVKWNRISEKNSLARFIAWGFNFGLIVIGWMIFRAPSVTWLVNTILHPSWGASGNQLIALLSVFTMTLVYIIPIVIKLLIDRAGKAREFLEPVYFALALVILVVFAASGLQDFVYTTF